MTERGGGRGTHWVAAQFALIAVAVALMAAGPARVESGWLRAAGLTLAVVGATLTVWAARALGRDLTPFTRPRPGAPLVETGPFALARHPIYGGLLAAFAGLGLATDLWSLAATGALAVVWLGKSREEERRLVAVFPGYVGYTRRVRRRFVPFLF